MGISMIITENIIEYVAALSKIELSEEEAYKAKHDLTNIFSHIETMNGLDTEDTLPMDHVFNIKNVFREDVVTGEDRRDELLKGAPCKGKGYFMVPKTVE